MLRELLYKIAKALDFPLKPERDYRVSLMDQEIRKMGGIKFRIDITSDGWLAECTNIKGILTGGASTKPSPAEVDELIKDAVFSAFNIPAYLSKSELIRTDNEPRRELTYVLQ